MAICQSTRHLPGRPTSTVVEKPAAPSCHQSALWLIRPFISDPVKPESCSCCSLLSIRLAVCSLLPIRSPTARSLVAPASVQALSSIFLSIKSSPAALEPGHLLICSSRILPCTFLVRKGWRLHSAFEPVWPCYGNHSPRFGSKTFYLAGHSPRLVDATRKSEQYPEYNYLAG
jgi:hypothetical protein